MAISHDAAARALYLLCYQDDSEVDGYVERFISRYGSLSLESARAALAQSDSFDHVFAIFLLGLSAYPTWQVHLRPYLTSADPWEQWSSVLCLGAVHDPAAFPLMCDLLTAQFPADPKVGQRTDIAPCESLAACVDVGLWRRSCWGPHCCI